MRACVREVVRDSLSMVYAPASSNVEYFGCRFVCVWVRTAPSDDEYFHNIAR